jgi:hypothetical protein
MVVLNNRSNLCINAEAIAQVLGEAKLKIFSHLLH